MNEWFLMIRRRVNGRRKIVGLVPLTFFPELIPTSICAVKPDDMQAA